MNLFLHNSFDEQVNVQHIADNVDHDLATIDGKGTIMATINPKGKFSFPLVPRKTVTDDDIKEAGKIEIKQHTIDTSALSSIKYVDLSPLFEYEDPTSIIDLLWMASWNLAKPRTGWHGTMQAVMVDSNPGKSDFVFLRIIDLSSSDPDCIYSTLDFIANQGNRYGFTPIVTFDQPLWWKAMLIIHNEGNGTKIGNIVLKLGGFHALMSFVSCIGQLYGDLGLREVFDVVYATNTTPHLLSGKAIYRAIRGHILVESALFNILCEDQIDSVTYDKVLE